MTLLHPSWFGLVLLGAAGAVLLSLVGDGGHRRGAGPSAGPRGRGRLGGTRKAAGARRPGPMSFGQVPRGATHAGAAGWATRRQLGPLVVRGVPPGRLVIGTLAARGGRPGRTLLAAEAAQSVAVVGPTQSGKTTALAVPAILGWQGPVLAASVKTDLLRDTVSWRRRCGRVWCFDPSGATGLPASRWSPLPACATWSGARRVASDLTEVAHGSGTTADGEFWYATAAKLLAPLFFAAAQGGLDMGDVVRWVDTQEVAEVVDILEAAGVAEALHAARATWQRDDRQRSSVYTTAETVLEPFAEPESAARSLQFSDTPPYGTPAVPGVRSFPWAGEEEVDATALLDGPNTLYLCAPAHDQRRLRAVFCALVKQVLEVAFDRAARRGRPLDPPLLVVLDEAANIAPLVDLDGLAATCAGHGVQLVTVWQDLSQVAARYGERGATVINNHRAKVFLSGTSDPRTLDHASHLVGEEELLVPSVTRDPSGSRTVTTSPLRRPLLPPEALRQLPVSSGVLVYGSLPPARLALRPWFHDADLARRVGGGLDPGPTLRSGGPA